MCAPAIAGFAQTYSCGANLTGKLDNGTLTISGSGPMTGFSMEGTPWWAVKGLITKVVIQGATTIGSNAFYYHENLTEIIVSESVKTIGRGAFAACLKLPSVVIPDGVTTLENEAFSTCRALTKVTLGSKVASIGKEAFYSCDALTEVICRNPTPPNVDAAAFQSAGISLYVPGSAVSAYKSHAVWKGFKEVRSISSIGTVYIDVMGVYRSDGGKLTSIPLDDVKKFTFVDKDGNQGDDFMNLYFADSMIRLDLNVYGKLAFEKESVKYKITFNTQGGSSIASVTGVEHGSLIGAPTAPSRAGYEFVGWYTDADGTTAWNFAASEAVSDTTLYAKWVEKLTVTFDSQGGGEIASITVIKDNRITAPAAPSRAGYDFVGWYINTVPWDFSNFTVTGNITLVARWKDRSAVIEEEEVRYTISFDSQGGGEITPVSTVSGSLIAAPAAPNKDGFVFAGWYTASDSVWNFAEQTVSSDITLYAKWNSVETGSCIVSFDTRGGSEIAPVTVVSGYVLSRPDVPLRAGYVFLGWYSDPGYAVVWDFAASVVVAGTTLYARWEVLKYRVTFSARGGSSVSAINNVAYGSLIPEPDPPSRKDYVFTGWYTDTEYAVAWDFATSTVVNNTTLYARWEAVEVPGGIARIQTASQPGFYPNPADGLITFGGLDGTVTFTLSDLTGKILFRRPVTNGETVSVAEMPRGVYLVRIGDKTLRLVKQ